MQGRTPAGRAGGIDSVAQEFEQRQAWNNVAWLAPALASRPSSFLQSVKWSHGDTDAGRTSKQDTPDAAILCSEMRSVPILAMPWRARSVSGMRVAHGAGELHGRGGERIARLAATAPALRTPGRSTNQARPVKRENDSASVTRGASSRARAASAPAASDTPASRNAQLTAQRQRQRHVRAATVLRAVLSSARLSSARARRAALPRAASSAALVIAKRAVEHVLRRQRACRAVRPPRRRS